MNNNRNQNRRRGRGNRPQGGGGGGNQMNRIDSRARGNAPQMLDKYKKLAQDAQHNGDRVQAEYYLQFADHYFRVISDNKVRQDEQRGRRDDRDGNDNEDGDEDDFDARRQQPQRENRGNRNRSRRDDGNRDDGRDDNRNDGRDDTRSNDRDDERSEGDDRDEGAEYEPAENPFVRTKRPQRGRSRRDEGAAEQGGEIDAAVLPPSISADGEGEKPRRRAARRPKSDDGEGETLKAVG